MTESRTTGSDMQEEILSAVRKSQATVVEAIRTWATAVQSIAPALPDVNVPLAEKLPKPQDLIAGAYDFAEQLLANQRKFAEDVLTAIAPTAGGQDEAPAKKSGPAAK
jgi:hypothetical protein